ncbi:MAG: hypothetical protein KF908_05305 [Nitrosomonas sp.]|nr:hypothetical protein [Nitrosomonas sp.]
MSDKKKIDAKYVREHFPVCVAFADECRAVFGDGVKMVYAKESGVEIGKQLTGDAEVCMTDVDLTPMQTPEQLRRGGRDGQ